MQFSEHVLLKRGAKRCGCKINLNLRDGKVNKLLSKLMGAHDRTKFEKKISSLE